MTTFKTKRSIFLVVKEENQIFTSGFFGGCDYSGFSPKNKTGNHNL
jgi:hypothetical protein